MNEDLDPQALPEEGREAQRKQPLSEGLGEGMDRDEGLEGGLSSEDGDVDWTSVEAELAPRLNRWTVEPARPAFRAQLREAFVQGEETSVSVNATLASVLDDFGEVPPARPEFRAALAAQFLQGSLEEEMPEIPADAPVMEPLGQEDEVPVATLQPVLRGPAPTRRSGRQTRANQPADSSRRWWAGAVVAAAAALLLVVLGPGWGTATPSSAWSLASGDTQLAQVFLDGVSSADLSAEEFAARLGSTQRVSTGETRARLVLERRLVVELGPNSEVVLAAAPESTDVVTFSGERGNLIFATGPEWGADQRLVVRTDQAEVEALGTVFGVDLYPEGTCICCGEGEVSVRSLEGGDDHRVASLERGFVTSDRGEFHTGAIMADHGAPIESLQQALPGIW